MRRGEAALVVIDEFLKNVRFFKNLLVAASLGVPIGVTIGGTIGGRGGRFFPISQTFFSFLFFCNAIMF